MVAVCTGDSIVTGQDGIKEKEPAQGYLFLGVRIIIPNNHPWKGTVQVPSGKDGIEIGLMESHILCRC